MTVESSNLLQQSLESSAALIPWLWPVPPCNAVSLHRQKTKQYQLLMCLPGPVWGCHTPWRELCDPWRVTSSPHTFCDVSCDHVISWNVLKIKHFFPLSFYRTSNGNLNDHLLWVLIMSVWVCLSLKPISCPGPARRGQLQRSLSSRPGF